MPIDYQIVSGDSGGEINVDSRTEPVTIALPAPINNFKITIKDAFGNAENNNITVIRGSDSITIDLEANDDIINQNFEAISYISDGTNWFRVSSFFVSTDSLALFGGGNGPLSTIDYVKFNTLGNATSFGNLTVARFGLGACASSVRGVWGGGGTGSVSNIIDYVTFSTLNSATSFGNLTVARQDVMGCSSGTRGIFGGGDTSGSFSPSAVIDYITMATTGNATSFGNLTAARFWCCGAMASPTRGVFVSGNNGGGPLNVMDYVTIATTSNATSFGSMPSINERSTACSNATIGLIAGGEVGGGAVTSTYYITIATTGNATFFGNLSVNTFQFASGAASPVRALIAGGNSLSNIEYFTFATASNSIAFGNLTSAKQRMGGCSNAHGGL